MRAILTSERRLFSSLGRPRTVCVALVPPRLGQLRSRSDRIAFLGDAHVAQARPAPPPPAEHHRRVALLCCGSLTLRRGGFRDARAEEPSCRPRCCCCCCCRTARMIKGGGVRHRARRPRVPAPAQATALAAFGAPSALLVSSLAYTAAIGNSIEPYFLMWCLSVRRQPRRRRRTHAAAALATRLPRGGGGGGTAHHRREIGSIAHLRSALSRARESARRCCRFCVVAVRCAVLLRFSDAASRAVVVVTLRCCGALVPTWRAARCQ